MAVDEQNRASHALWTSEKARVDFLYDHLDDELAGVRRILDDAFQVNGTLMQEVADYVAASRGKMLRPCIVLLAARGCGFDGAQSDDHVKLGAAIELLHLATLLHDDVIDKAPTRRGRPTVNAKWGDDVAILFADYLYATSFDLALATMNPSTMRVLSEVTQRMTEGEFLQIERRGEWLSIDDYLRIIRSKTGYLFGASASLGGAIAGAEPQAIAKLAEYGVHFGMSFQITDDALDYEAQGAKWGKRVGADLKEGKQTLPLLRALSEATDEDRAALTATLNNGRDFATVHGYVRKYKTIEYSLEVAAEHSRKATDALDHFPSVNPEFDRLRRIADAVLARQY